METCEHCGATAVDAQGICQNCGWRALHADDTSGETREAEIAIAPEHVGNGATPPARPVGSGSFAVTAGTQAASTIGTPAPATKRFCGTCGAPLEPGQAFCGQCGSPVAPGTPPYESMVSTALTPAPNRSQARHDVGADGNGWGAQEANALTEAVPQMLDAGAYRGSALRYQGGAQFAPATPRSGSGPQAAPSGSRTLRLTLGTIFLLISIVCAIAAIVILTS